MKKQKLGSIKRALSVLLALVMLMSIVPMAGLVGSAAGEPTAPYLSEGAASPSYAKGSYVTFGINQSKFHFVRTEDNQKFQFTFQLTGQINGITNSGHIDALSFTNFTVDGVTWDTDPVSVEDFHGSGFNRPTHTFTGTYTFTSPKAESEEEFFQAGINYQLNYWYAGSQVSSWSKDGIANFEDFRIFISDKRPALKLLAEAEAIVADPNSKNVYTNVSYTRLVDNIATHKPLIESTATTAQADINVSAAALREALSMLTYKPANYDAVDAAIAAAQTKIENGDWTSASIANVNNAIAAVDRSYNILRQADVDAMAAAINLAADNLAALGKCDYTALDAALAKADTAYESAYYAQGYSQFNIARGEARNFDRDLINDEAGVNQAAVDAAAKKLSDAFDALVLKKADYTKVENAIWSADRKVAEGDWTSASVNAVNAAKNAVVYDLDITEQARVDAFAAAITEAAANLTKLGVCDYSKLAEAIATLPENEEKYYTAESYAAYTAALEAAEKVPAGMLNDEAGVNQGVINDATAALNEALANLTLKPADYTKYNRIVEYVAGLNPDNYIDFTALQAAVDVDVSGKNILQQAEVDAQFDAIQQEIAKLKFKDADYAGVEAALARVPADMSVYTRESSAAVQNAVNRVIYGLKKNRQDMVDGWAAAINKAVDELEFLPADFVAYEAAVAEAKLLNPDDYVDFSGVTAALAVDVSGKNITEQADVDAATKAILDAIDALELKAEIAPSSILSVRVVNDVNYPGLFPVEVKTTADVRKVQFYYHTLTATFTAESSRVVSVTENDDGTLTWIINISAYGPGNMTIEAHARTYTAGWETSVRRSVAGISEIPVVEEYGEILSVEKVSADVPEMYDFSDIIVKVSDDSTKLQVRYVDGLTRTFNLTPDMLVEDGDGYNVYRLSVRVGAENQYEYDLAVRGKTGWNLVVVPVRLIELTVASL